MKRMRLLSLLLALVLVCTAMPVTAAAADGLASATVCTTHTVHTEGQSAEDCTGLAPYLAPDGTAWAAVGDDTTKVKTWHCFQQDIDAALTDALHRMLRRETAFTLYIAVEKSDYDPTTDKLQKALYERLRSNALAEKAGTIEGGDFLDAQIQDFRQDDLKISWLNVEGYDDWNGPVAFYEVHCTFKYCDTVQQMEILRQAAEKWNQLFVTDNPTIAAEKDTNRRQYLIVKTIYDFLAENTVYNTAAYENFMNHQVTDWYAHTAYAAFFGLTGQGAADLDSTGYDWSVRQKNSLTVIGTTGQGKAVCEGYAALFYYLCRLNGIACNTVMGSKMVRNEITGELQKDMHAWNFVYLDDGTGSGYQWYQVDATFAASNNLRFPGFINYYYFLCGSKNAYFTLENDHQQLDDTKSYPLLSATDYRFASTGENLSDFDGQGYMVLMRRGAEGQIRDSILIQRAADGSCAYFKAQTDGNGTVLTDENGQAKVTPLPDGTGLDYVGEEGEFSLLIPGYVFGREYTTVYETGDDRYAPGQHTIIATDGTAQLSCSFYLNKIDVTKEKNQIELHNLDKNGAITYNVCPIQVDVHVVDGYGHTAVRDKDYTVLFLDENGTQVDTLSEPGKYTIVLDFSISDRYTGKLEGNSTNRLRFEIAKLPMNRAGFGDVQAPYSGKSIADVMSAMTFVGTTTDGKPYKKVFKEGEDYALTYSGSTVHAGSGTYTVTALEGSKYLTGSATYTYTIAPASIAGYGGSDVCAPVTYNGSAQRPGTAWFDSQSGLKSGRDYTVVRYSANTNAGTANVTVQGKGDYTGTAVLHFKINQKSLNDRDVSVRCTPTAKGATIKATYKGKTLQQNKDYTVSIATRGTTRTVTVQGKGNFNSRRQFKIHVHAYKCTAKKAATYFATGYKKYKCTACGAKKTEKLAQLKPAIVSLKSSKKGRLTVKWKKGSGISGYQISYSTSSKFTKSTTKSVTITKAGTTAKTLTKLKSKKKYYVRIRVYKKQKGGKLYGAWSPVKSTKVR